MERLQRPQLLRVAPLASQRALTRRDRLDLRRQRRQRAAQLVQPGAGFVHPAAALLAAGGLAQEADPRLGRRGGMSVQRPQPPSAARAHHPAAPAQPQRAQRGPHVPLRHPGRRDGHQPLVLLRCTIRRRDPAVSQPVGVEQRPHPLRLGHGDDERVEEPGVVKRRLHARGQLRVRGQRPGEVACGEERHVHDAVLPEEPPRGGVRRGAVRLHVAIGGEPLQPRLHLPHLALHPAAHRLHLHRQRPQLVACLVVGGQQRREDGGGAMPPRIVRLQPREHLAKGGIRHAQFRRPGAPRAQRGGRSGAPRLRLARGGAEAFVRLAELAAREVAGPARELQPRVGPGECIVRRPDGREHAPPPLHLVVDGGARQLRRRGRAPLHADPFERVAGSLRARGQRQPERAPRYARQLVQPPREASALARPDARIALDLLLFVLQERLRPAPVVAERPVRRGCFTLFAPHGLQPRLQVERSVLAVLRLPHGQPPLDLRPGLPEAGALRRTDGDLVAGRRELGEESGVRLLPAAVLRRRRLVRDRRLPRGGEHGLLLRLFQRADRLELPADVVELGFDGVQPREHLGRALDGGALDGRQRFLEVRLHLSRVEPLAQLGGAHHVQHFQEAVVLLDRSEPEERLVDRGLVALLVREHLARVAQAVAQLARAQGAGRLLAVVEVEVDGHAAWAGHHEAPPLHFLVGPVARGAEPDPDGLEHAGGPALELQRDVRRALAVIGRRVGRCVVLADQVIADGAVVAPHGVHPVGGEHHVEHQRDGRHEHGRLPGLVLPGEHQVAAGEVEHLRLAEQPVVLKDQPARHPPVGIRCVHGREHVQHARRGTGQAEEVRLHRSTQKRLS